MPRLKKKSLQALREQRLNTVAANLLAGLSYRQMASALGVSHMTIKADVDVLLARWRADQVKTVQDKIELDLRRIDLAHNALWAKVLEGDHAAIDRFCSLLDRRIKLAGTASPHKIAPTTPEGDKPYDPLGAVDDQMFANVAAILAQYGRLEGHVDRGEEGEMPGDNVE